MSIRLGTGCSSNVVMILRSAFSLIFHEGAIGNDSVSVYAWFHFFVNMVLVIRVIAVQQL